MIVEYLLHQVIDVNYWVIFNLNNLSIKICKNGLKI